MRRGKREKSFIERVIEGWNLLIKLWYHHRKYKEHRKAVKRRAKSIYLGKKYKVKEIKPAKPVKALPASRPVSKRSASMPDNSWTSVIEDNRHVLSQTKEQVKDKIRKRLENACSIYFNEGGLFDSIVQVDIKYFKLRHRIDIYYVDTNDYQLRILDFVYKTLKKWYFEGYLLREAVTHNPMTERLTHRGFKIDIAHNKITISKGNFKKESQFDINTFKEKSLKPYGETITLNDLIFFMSDLNLELPFFLNSVLNHNVLPISGTEIIIDSKTQKLITQIRNKQQFKLEYYLSLDDPNEVILTLSNSYTKQELFCATFPNSSGNFYHYILQAFNLTL